MIWYIGDMDKMELNRYMNMGGKRVLDDKGIPKGPHSRL
jgi:hypothetical protein